jgi:presequence protease
MIRAGKSCLRNRAASLRAPKSRYLSSNALSVGDQIGKTSYKISNIFDIPSQQLQVYDLTHEGTKSRHVHVAKDDDNSVFCIGFRTNPPDHSGLPHILEHTTLCGSSKYPVRDPFFLMLTRSLANFMNAMTGFDYTFYPFATTNAKDFKNLQNVYLDAVFRPLLREQDFRQEGWRLENADPKDKSSPLEFKGVVYNEMKGQMVGSKGTFVIFAPLVF